MKILCVCTHGYFRSQIMAALVTARGHEARAAGTCSDYLGRAPHPDVLRAIRERGVENEGYVAQLIVLGDLLWADCVLCAEQEHLDYLKDIFGGFFNATGLTSPPTYVLGIPDGGVDNPDAVSAAAVQITEWIEQWNSSTR